MSAATSPSDGGCLFLVISTGLLAFVVRDLELQGVEQSRVDVVGGLVMRTDRAYRGAILRPRGQDPVPAWRQPDAVRAAFVRRVEKAELPPLTLKGVRRPPKWLNPRPRLLSPSLAPVDTKPCRGEWTKTGSFRRSWDDRMASIHH